MPSSCEYKVIGSCNLFVAMVDWQSTLLSLKNLLVVILPFFASIPFFSCFVHFLLIDRQHNYYFYGLVTQHLKKESYQAPVVQTLDSAIHWIKIYLVDNAIGFPNTYPLDSDLSGDSAIQRLNYGSQGCH